MIMITSSAQHIDLDGGARVSSGSRALPFRGLPRFSSQVVMWFYVGYVSGAACVFAAGRLLLIFSTRGKPSLSKHPRSITFVPSLVARPSCRLLQLETIPMYNYPNFLNLFTTFVCECATEF